MKAGCRSTGLFFVCSLIQFHHFIARLEGHGGFTEGRVEVGDGNGWPYPFDHNFTHGPGVPKNGEFSALLDANIRTPIECVKTI